MEDEALVLAYQNGDVAAFDELYRRYSGRVHGYARSKVSAQLGGAEVIDELVQAVFLKLHERRHDFDPKFLFVQWLFVIARSVVIDRLRKKDSWLQFLPAEELNDFADEAVQSPTTSPNSGLSSYLEQLPPESRQIVEMRLLNEDSYRTISKTLGRSEVSVRQIFSRAIKALKSTAKGPRHAE
jgi:RNA polymerase sigma-70 factor (ECF subfamily)